MSTLQIRVYFTLLFNIYFTLIEDKFCAHSSLISTRIAAYPIKKTPINGAGKSNQSQTTFAQSNIELKNEH